MIKKQPQVIINYNDNAIHNGDNIANTRIVGEASHESSDSPVDLCNKESSKRTLEKTISTEVRSNPISSLFSYMYKLVSQTFLKCAKMHSICSIYLLHIHK